MDVVAGAICVLVPIAGLVGFGAYLRYCIADTPTEREQALAKQIDAMKRANRLGVEYFHAQAQMREEMAKAAAESPRVVNGRASVPTGNVIDGERVERR